MIRERSNRRNHHHSVDTRTMNEPLNENEVKGSRQLHDRIHYGSAAPDLQYPLRESIRPRGIDRGFEGVGPRGYRRSDDRIEEDVCNVLMKDRNIDASDIEVHVRDGIVTLSGTVDSRMEKIEAEMAVENISGVEDVQNQLKLKKWGDYSDRPYQREWYDRNPRGDNRPKGH